MMANVDYNRTRLKNNVVLGGIPLSACHLLSFVTRYFGVFSRIFHENFFSHVSTVFGLVITDKFRCILFTDLWPRRFWTFSTQEAVDFAVSSHLVIVVALCMYKNTHVYTLRSEFRKLRHGTRICITAGDGTVVLGVCMRAYTYVECMHVCIYCT